MSLLDLCTGSAPIQTQKDSDIIAIAKRSDEQLDAIRREARRIQEDISATANSKLDAVKKYTDEIFRAIRAFGDSVLARTIRQSRAVSDSLSLRTNIEQQEVLLRLQMLGVQPLLQAIPESRPQQPGAGYGQTWLGDTGSTVPSNRGANEPDSRTVGSGIGGTTNEVGETSGANVKLQARAAAVPASGIRTGSSGQSEAFADLPKDDTLYVRKRDGTFVPVALANRPYPSGMVDIPIDKPIRNIYDTPLGRETPPTISQEEFQERLVGTTPDTLLTVSGQGNGEPVGQGIVGGCSPPVPSFAEWLEQAGIDISQVCELTPDAIEQAAERYAQERENRAGETISRTNPVGIEQPGAFRFQQRLQPWYRDMIEWSGELSRMFANSSSEAQFIALAESFKYKEIDSDYPIKNLRKDG